MKMLMLIIFFVSTSIHLYASLKINRKLRNITKPFILTSLLGYYCLTTNNVELTVVLALIFSWIGDVFLMFKGVKYFTIGGIGFMISHFFFILSYNKQVDFSSFNILYVIVLTTLYFIIVSILFSRLKKYLPKPLFYPMYLYLFINGNMNCFAIYRLLTNFSTMNIVTCIGAILFFISDSCLFFVRFKKDVNQSNHFIVMLTYSIGELLIVLGLI